MAVMHQSGKNQLERGRYVSFRIENIIKILFGEV